MTVSEAQYREALAALEEGANDPDFDDEIAEGLIAMVEEYERSDPARRRDEQIGKMSGLSGFRQPSGLEALEQTLGPPEPELGDAGDTELFRRLKPKPSGHEATKADIAGQLGVQPYEPSDEDVFERAAREDAARALAYDDSLPSASKRKDVFRPPEYFPPESDPEIQSVGDALAGLQTVLPRDFGGRTVMHQEPGIDTFRRDMYPMLGDKVLGLDETSLAYREYADLVWQRAYDQAEGRGVPIVRMAHMKDPDHFERLRSAVTQGGRAAVSALHGAEELALAGIPHAIEREIAPEAAALEEGIADANPTARVVGRVGGAVAPFGVGGLAARGAAGAVGRIGGGRIPQALAAGSVGAAAETAAEQAVDELSLGTPMDTGDVLEAGITGGAVGGAFGALGSAGARYRARNRDAGRQRELAPALLAAEDAGARLRLFGGIQVPEDIQRARRSAAELGTQPNAVIAGQMGDDYLQVGVDEASRLAQKHADEARQYYRTPAAKTPKSVGVLLQRATSIHAGRSAADGAPVAMQEGANARLRQYIDSMVEDVRAIEPHEAPGVLASARARNPHAFQLPSLAEGRRRGINVDKWTAEQRIALEKAGMADVLENYALVVTPRKYDARQLDETIDGINKLLKEGSRTGAPDEALEPLGEAARRVRDQFAPGGPVSDELKRTITTEDGRTRELSGWSAFKKLQEEELEGLGRQLSDAGLPQNVGRLSPEQRSGVISHLSSLGSTYVPLTPDQVAAHELYATRAGRADDLRRLRGLGAVSKLEDMHRWLPRVTTGGSGVRGYAAINPDALTLRLDALGEIMERPGRGFGAARGAATYQQANEPAVRGGVSGGVGPEQIPALRLDEPNMAPPATGMGTEDIDFFMNPLLPLMRHLREQRARDAAEARRREGVATAGERVGGDRILTPRTGPTPGEMQDAYHRQMERTDVLHNMDVESGPDPSSPEVHNLFWQTLGDEATRTGEPTTDAKIIRYAHEVFRRPETVLWFLNHNPDGSPKQHRRTYSMQDVMRYRPGRFVM